MLNKGDHILVNFQDEAVKGCVTSINDSFYGVRITNTKTIWPKPEDILKVIDLEDLSIDEQVKTTLPIHGIPVGSVVTVIDSKIPKRWKKSKYGVEYQINGKKLHRLVYRICLEKL